MSATANNNSFVVPALIHPDARKSNRPLETRLLRAATRPVFLVLNANEESALEGAQIQPVQRDGVMGWGGARMDESTSHR